MSSTFLEELTGPNRVYGYDLTAVGILLSLLSTFSRTLSPGDPEVGNVRPAYLTSPATKGVRSGRDQKLSPKSHLRTKTMKMRSEKIQRPERLWLRSPIIHHAP